VDDKATVIDTQANVEGKLTGKDAHILGRFRGEIELSGRILMGEGSRVEAKVKADAAEIAGEFKGELSARNLLLLEKGRVEGTLDAQTIAVREGAQLNGSVSSGGPKAHASVPQAVGGAVSG
jgi:cytoskeletal protein CcmA (bactofilin family)